jgi:16S rRNA (cytosine967-C5)-methyltransferase
MAASAGDRAEIVAADIRAARVHLLRETVRSSGAHSIRVVQADLEAGLPFGPIFDLVFVDAPCSGLGTIRRDPDIRWRRTEADLPDLARAQGRMMKNAAKAVAPGGTLVYATCSSEPEENEAIVTEFVDADRSFRPIDLRDELRAERSPRLTVLEPVLDSAGFLRTLPETHGLEAFFGAVLRRVK